MKAFALLILATTAIAQAMLNSRHGSNQDTVKISGPLNSLGSRVGLKSGGGDSQYGVKKAQADAPEGLWTVVGPDGVVSTVNVNFQPIAIASPTPKAGDAGSNGRQEGQQNSPNTQPKGKRPNSQQPGNDKQHRNQTQSNGQQPGPKHEGLRLTFVTVTVRPTVAKEGVGAGTKLPGTVTTTVTVSAGSTPQKLSLQPQNSQDSSRKPNTGGAPTPNADGNGVGVTTVPIDKTALPTTTHSLNPPAPPPAAPPKPESSSSLPPVPAPVAPTKSPQPAAPQPDAQSRSSGSPSSSTSSSVLKAPISPSSDSATLGGQAPPPTAPLDSVVAPVATTPAGVVAPAQPVVNLSGLTLNSIIDLGNLPKQTGNARAPITVAV